VVGIPEGRGNHYEEFDVGGRIILKWISKKQDGGLA
jgi:hypothetical protein